MALPQVNVDTRQEAPGALLNVLRAAGVMFGKNKLERDTTVPGDTNPEQAPHYKTGFWDTVYGSRGARANQAADIDAYNRAAELSDLPKKYQSQFEYLEKPRITAAGDVESRLTKERGTEQRTTLRQAGEQDVDLANINNDARMELQKAADAGHLVRVNAEGQQRLALADREGNIRKMLNADEAKYAMDRLKESIVSQSQLQTDAHLNRLIEMGEGTRQAVRQAQEMIPVRTTAQIEEYKNFQDALDGKFGEGPQMEAENKLRGMGTHLTPGATVLFGDRSTATYTPRGMEFTYPLGKNIAAQRNAIKGAAPAGGTPAVTPVTPAPAGRQGLVPSTATVVGRGEPSLGAAEGSRGQEIMGNLNQMVDKTVKGIYNPVADRLSQSAFVGSPAYNLLFGKSPTANQ